MNAIAGCLIAIMLFSCSNQDDSSTDTTANSTASELPVFTFTAIPDQDEQRLQERFSKVATYLSTELGITVKYIPVKSYSASVTAFANNQVQLAWFGSLSGVQARNKVANSKAIAQGVEDQHFTSYLIANASTGIKFSETFPKEIQGKTFTFGSKGSTSGRLMPEFHIREAFDGQSPDEVFERVGFSGDHSKTIQLVQSGAYQVGALNFKVWDTESKKGLIDNEKVNLIWQTPAYPNYQWSIRGDVDETWGEGFTEKVTQVILNIKDPEILESFPRSAFIPTSNDNYAPILKTGKAIGILD